MSLRPHVVAYLKGLPSTEQTREEIVEQRKFEPNLVPPIEFRPPVQAVTDQKIPGPSGEIPIRIYTPEGEGPFPLLVFFHGGGFVLSSIETHDVVCRYLALDTGCKVISVGYRLAPEYPFPAAPEDCYAATKWVADHSQDLNGDASKLYVAGDSAGGNLATVVCLVAKEQGGPFIAKQVLLYPVTDFHSAEVPTNYPSYDENATGYGLSNRKMSHFWDLYIKDKKDAKNPYASPMQANNVSQLPPALVITIDKDVLRDEGEAYGKRLQEAGVPVRFNRVEGTIHGYMRSFPDQEESIETRKLVAAFLKE